MSLREITVQYLGDALRLPKLERDVKLVATEDGKRFVRERTTTRNGKSKTRYGRRVPLCEICGYAIGDDRWSFCPKCGARIGGDGS